PSAALPHSMCPPVRAPLDLSPFPTRRSSDLLLDSRYHSWTSSKLNHYRFSLSTGSLQVDSRFYYFQSACFYIELLLLYKCEKVIDRKSTRLNSSHASTSYAVSCLQKRIQETE